MVALETPQVERGAQAPDFRLKGIDGAWHTRDTASGPNGLLVMFICNHCPYVKAIVDRMVADAKALQAEGIGVIGIMSNDVDSYPEDSYENMQAFAQRHGFSFPYVIDETQDVAAAYGAVCTPDFFGYNAAGELQYRGRLDASRREAVPDAKRDLLEAMREVARSGVFKGEQYPSIGCNIKWRAEAA